MKKSSKYLFSTLLATAITVLMLPASYAQHQGGGRSMAEATAVVLAAAVHTAGAAVAVTMAAAILIPHLRHVADIRPLRVVITITHPVAIQAIILITRPVVLIRIRKVAITTTGQG
jgi:hypothetical protein